MLRKTRKLNLSWDNNRYFYREFKIFRGVGLNIYFRHNNQLDESKMSVVVGKKVSKLAVTRNSIKRSLYDQAKNLGIGDQNLDVVIVALEKIEASWQTKILKNFLTFLKK